MIFIKRKPSQVDIISMCLWCDITSDYHTLCYKQAPSWYDLKGFEKDIIPNTKKHFTIQHSHGSQDDVKNGAIKKNNKLLLDIKDTRDHNYGAARNLDFDNASNASSVTSNTTDDTQVLLGGPTTRRQWSEITKVPGQPTLLNSDSATNLSTLSRLSSHEDDSDSVSLQTHHISQEINHIRLAIETKVYGSHSK